MRSVLCVHVRRPCSVLCGELSSVEIMVCEDQATLDETNHHISAKIKLYFFKYFAKNSNVSMTRKV